MSNINAMKKLMQQLSAEERNEIVAELESKRLDPKNPSQAVSTRTVFMKESNVSKYRPKRVSSYGLDSAPYIDILLSGNVSAPFEVIRELQHNRDHCSNIAYVNMADKSVKNFSTNISSWLNKDLIVAIKTKEQFDDITLASMAAGIQIDLFPEKGKRYFMFNPSLLLPYSRMDKGKHFDTIYLIYQYLKNYSPPAKSAYQDCFKKYKDAMVKEYFKDSNQCSFDEFLDRSKEYVNQCLQGNEPTLEGWFKLCV